MKTNITIILNEKNNIFFELCEYARFHFYMENEQNRLKAEVVELLYRTFPHPEIIYQKYLERLITINFNSTDKALSIKKAENYANKLVKPHMKFILM